jgi:hypothetical protein
MVQNVEKKFLNVHRKKRIYKNYEIEKMNRKNGKKLRKVYQFNITKRFKTLGRMI